MRAILIALAAVSCLACEDAVTQAGGTVAGLYTLRTVNGAALPYTVPGAGTTKTEILADSIQINAIGTFSRAQHLRVTTSGQPAQSAVRLTGTYTLQGTSITFRNNEDGGQSVALGNATTMTFIEAGVTSVFSK